MYIYIGTCSLAHTHTCTQIRSGLRMSARVRRKSPHFPCIRCDFSLFMTAQLDRDALVEPAKQTHSWLEKRCRVSSLSLSLSLSHSRLRLPKSKVCRGRWRRSFKLAIYVCMYVRSVTHVCARGEGRELRTFVLRRLSSWIK